MTYGLISDGSVSEIHRMGLHRHTDIDTRGVVVSLLETDFHMVLGLGTGDIILKPSAAGAAPIILENVWRISKKYPEISDRIRRMQTT
jgi:hypothetical protein